MYKKARLVLISTLSLVAALSVFATTVVVCKEGSPDPRCPKKCRNDPWYKCEMVQEQFTHEVWGYNAEKQWVLLRTEPATRLVSRCQWIDRTICS